MQSTVLFSKPSALVPQKCWKTVHNGDRTRCVGSRHYLSYVQVIREETQGHRKTWFKTLVTRSTAGRAEAAQMSQWQHQSRINI